MLQELAALKIGTLVVTSLADEAAEIMKQARQTPGLEKMQLLGGNSFNSPTLIAKAGGAMEGAVSGAAWHISSLAPANAAFLQAYRAKFSADPGQVAALAYTGVNLVAEGIKSSGSKDSAKVREAMLQIKNLDTPLGVFLFSDHRAPMHTSVVQTVRNGKFEVLVYGKGLPPPCRLKASNAMAVQAPFCAQARTSGHVESESS